MAPAYPQLPSAIAHERRPCLPVCFVNTRVGPQRCVSTDHPAGEYGAAGSCANAGAASASDTIAATMRTMLASMREAAG